MAPFMVKLLEGKNGEQLLLDFLSRLELKRRWWSYFDFDEIDHICIVRRLDYYEQNGPQGRFEMIDDSVHLYVDGYLSKFYIAHAVGSGDPTTIYAVSAFYKKDKARALDSVRSLIRSVLLGP